MMCGISHDAGGHRGADRNFHMDRDMRMYDSGDRARYSDRPMLPSGHRSHSPEYRAPPQRSQRGGRSGPSGEGHGGGPRGYDGAGTGGAGGSDDDMNLLMNLSSMLS